MRAEFLHDVDDIQQRGRAATAIRYGRSSTARYAFQHAQ
jgi:hypothetical protein